MTPEEAVDKIMNATRPLVRAEVEKIMWEVYNDARKWTFQIDGKQVFEAMESTFPPGWKKPGD